MIPVHTIESKERLHPEGWVRTTDLRICSTLYVEICTLNPRAILTIVLIYNSMDNLKLICRLTIVQYMYYKSYSMYMF